MLEQKYCNGLTLSRQQQLKICLKQLFQVTFILLRVLSQKTVHFQLPLNYCCQARQYGQYYKSYGDDTLTGFPVPVAGSGFRHRQPVGLPDNRAIGHHHYQRLLVLFGPPSWIEGLIGFFKFKFYLCYFRYFSASFVP